VNVLFFCATSHLRPHQFHRITVTMIGRESYDMSPFISQLNSSYISASFLNGSTCFKSYTVVSVFEI
jgi:hypothetical protein